MAAALQRWMGRSLQFRPSFVARQSVVRPRAWESPLGQLQRRRLGRTIWRRGIRGSRLRGIPRRIPALAGATKLEVRWKADATFDLITTCRDGSRLAPSNRE